MNTKIGNCIKPQCTKLTERGDIMYLIGIDISKYKHDCFIATETGEVIKDVFSFDNNQKGFTILLNILEALDPIHEKKDRS